MTVLTRSAAAAALLVMLSTGGSSQAADPPATAKAAARHCFWTRDVNNFSALDDRTVNIRVGLKDIYSLDLFGACPDIDWTQKIGIESRGGSSICTGFDATLIVPSTIGTQRCTVRNIRKLTPEEIAALPPKAKP
jgi:hypothetical protein